jgi:hypothetical protein
MFTSFRLGGAAIGGAAVELTDRTGDPSSPVPVCP